MLTSKNNAPKSCEYGIQSAIPPVTLYLFSHMSDNHALNIMLVDDEPGRAAILKEALQSHGHQVIYRCRVSSSIYQMVQAFSPDVIIVDTKAPDRDILEDLALVSDKNPKPVLVVSEQDDQEIIEQAIKSGASAYVMDGLPANRLRGVLRTAIARFNEYQALKQELTSTRNELHDRKIIEKAKGLLMKHKGIDENEAFTTLRNLAMQKNRRLGEIATDIVDLLG